MRVLDVMKHLPTATNAHATLADTGRRMADIGCGMLPVVNGERNVVGVVTDRDICLALAHANVPASELEVSAAMTAPAYTCRAEDDIESALSTLGHHRVRRLPVVDAAGRLAGVLSLDDVALRYTEEEPRATHAASIARALRAICAPPLPAVR